MKYSNYFKVLMMLSLFFAGCAANACLENMPTFCAVLCILSFCFWFAGIMAPDSEKYTKEYLKKYKGWS